MFYPLPSCGSELRHRWSRVTLGYLQRFIAAMCRQRNDVGTGVCELDQGGSAQVTKLQIEWNAGLCGDATPLVPKRVALVRRRNLCRLTLFHRRRLAYHHVRAAAQGAIQRGIELGINRDVDRQLSPGLAGLDVAGIPTCNST